MTITKDDILGALPSLTRPELEAIEAMCRQLCGGRVGNVEQLSHPLGLIVFNALTATLGLTMPYAQYSPTSARQFEKRLPELISFLDKYFAGWAASRNRQLAFLRMLFELLYNDLVSRGVKPTLGIMIVNIGRMAEVFDAQFPGYRHAGIAASVILKHFK